VAYLPAGFAPEEEQEVLAILRAQKDSQRLENVMRGITAVATIVGFAYTLSQFGKLIKERRRAKEQ
jgi:hypothetical protein